MKVACLVVFGPSFHCTAEGNQHVVCQSVGVISNQAVSTGHLVFHPWSHFDAALQSLGIVGPVGGTDRKMDELELQIADGLNVHAVMLVVTTEMISWMINCFC